MFIVIPRPRLKLHNIHLMDENVWVVRARAFIGLGVAAILFLIGSSLLRVTPEPHYTGSLLAQDSPATSLLAVVILLVAACSAVRVIVGTMSITDRTGVETSIFLTSLALVALSARGGTIQPVLFSHPTPAVFLLLALETAILFAMLLLCVWVLRLFSPDESGETTEPGENDAIHIRVLTILTQAAVMSACMLFLAQSESKYQALAAVGISALLGSMAAYFTFPQSTSLYYWLGPMVVGIVGFVASYLSPSGQAIGFPDGPLGALARVLPIDFASIGVAGAIMGYWMGYGWAHEGDELEDEADTETPAEQPPDEPKAPVAITTE